MPVSLLYARSTQRRVGVLAILIIFCYPHVPFPNPEFEPWQHGPQALGVGGGFEVKGCLAMTTLALPDLVC